MLTSDLSSSKYSEAEAEVGSFANTSSSLTSEFSDYLGSEADGLGEDSNSENSHAANGSGSGHKKRTKSRNRIQKKVKYWTLPTMSSGTFNPSMLTARQQLQYLAQKSKLGADSDSLEMSPLRLDRIKFEEMKSLGSSSTSSLSKDSDLQFHSPNSKTSSNSPSSKLSSKSPTLKTSSNSPTSSPSPLSVASKRDRDRDRDRDRTSQLKEKICSSPLVSSAMKSNNQVKKKQIVEMKSPTISKEMKSPVILKEMKSPITSKISIEIKSSFDNPIKKAPSKPSLLNNIKGFLFDYNHQRRKHFENFLKDFARRMGVAVDDELVERKREEIINKGMI